MSALQQEIADRIRSLREAAGIEAAALAAAMGLSPARYDAYESGRDDIPAGLLCRLAGRLGADPAVLLTGDSPRMTVFSVTRRGKGAAVARRAAYRYQNLAANFAHPRVEPFLVTVEPKPEGTPVEMNSHPGQEFDYVLRGSLGVLIHGTELVLAAGDAVIFDAAQAHGMRAIGAEPCEFLAVIA